MINTKTRINMSEIQTMIIRKNEDFYIKCKRFNKDSFKCYGQYGCTFTNIEREGDLITETTLENVLNKYVELQPSKYFKLIINDKSVSKEVLFYR